MSENLNTLDLKALQDEMMTTVTAFRAENNKRIEQEKANGTALASTVSNVEKLNSKIDEIQSAIKAASEAAEKRMDTIESTVNRPGGMTGTEANGFTALHISQFRSMTGNTVDASALANYRDALGVYMRKGKATPADVENTLRVGIDKDGGYWVTPDMSGRIVQKVYETSPMRRYASVVNISTNQLDGAIDNDEASSGWVGEEGTRTETDSPQIGKWSIPVYEQYALPKTTQQVLDDADFGVESWLEMKVADKLARTENTAFFTGNGSGKPRGILDYTTAATADSSRAWGTVEHVATGSNGAFNATDPADYILDLFYALKNDYRRNAVFMGRRAVYKAIRKFQDGNGQYLWQPGMQAGQPAQIFGVPAVEAEDMGDHTSTNALGLGVGDFKAAYQIVDRQGIRVLRDNLTSKGFVLFYFTKRVGGGLVNSEAVKFLKFAA